MVFMLMIWLEKWQKSLNKKVFPFVTNYKGFEQTFYLRKEASIHNLIMFAENFGFYITLFAIQSGLDEQNGNNYG